MPPPPRKNKNRTRRPGKPGKLNRVSAQQAKPPRPTPPAQTPAHSPASGAPLLQSPILRSLTATPTAESALAIAFAVLILCLLVVASYLPAAFAGFVWDDATIVESKDVAAFSGLWNIWASPGSIYNEAHYWPMVYTTFWLEHKLWGFTPRGYHLVNVAFHLANVLVLWRLLRRMEITGAWFAAAVFAVHPLHVESVLWVIERKDVLSGLFYLLAVSAYLRFAAGHVAGHIAGHVAGHIAERRNWWLYFGALLFYTLGLFSKSIVVTLPAALLIWHWWKHGRITYQNLLTMLPFFAVGLVITLGDLTLAASKETIVSFITISERFLNAAHALWFYLGKLVLPVQLAVIYPHFNAADSFAWWYLFAAVLLALLLWIYRRKISRGPLAAALFFAITLSPTLGFVDYGYMRFSLVADRFQYLAGIGVLVLFVAAAGNVAQRVPAALRKGIPVAMTALLILLATATYRQAQVWRNPETLFAHIIQLNPHAESAHYNLANEYKRQGRTGEALENYRIAVQRKPNSADVHNQLGLTLRDLGNHQQAEMHFLRSIEIKPGYAKGLTNLAAMRVGQSRYDDAITLYQRAVQHAPELAAAHSGLGSALLNMGRREDALQSFERALAIDPTMEHALRNRARVLKMLQNNDAQ